MPGSRQPWRAQRVSFFDDKSKEPTSLQLDKALGETAALLKRIEQHLTDQFGEITREYTEGRSIRFDVSTTDDIAVVKQLIAIKMSS
jgi:hypothetical protein